jgi:hypothetical protein
VQGVQHRRVHGVHTLLKSRCVLILPMAASRRRFAVLRLFRAETAHHPLILVISRGVSARFVRSLLQNLFELLDLHQADALAGAGHANAS